MPVYSKKLGNSHHEHNIFFKTDIGLYKCNGCREFGFDAGFICENCHFVLHDQCAVEFNRNIMVPHFSCNFILISRVNDVICYVCNIPVKGYAYFSTNGDCEVIVHPPCAKLPRYIKTGQEGLVLELSRDIKSKCFWCNQRKLPGTKTNWGYASKGTCIHICCVRELFVRQWQTGTIFSPSNCGHTNNTEGAGCSNNTPDFKPRRSHVEVVGENLNNKFFSCIPDKVHNLVTMVLALISAVLGLQETPTTRRCDPRFELMLSNMVEPRQLKYRPRLSTNTPEPNYPKHGITITELEPESSVIGEQTRQLDPVSSAYNHMMMELNEPKSKSTFSEDERLTKESELESMMPTNCRDAFETKPKHQFSLTVQSSAQQNREPGYKTVIVSANLKSENELQLKSEFPTTTEKKREHETGSVLSSTTKQRRESEIDQNSLTWERGRETTQGNRFCYTPDRKNKSIQPESISIQKSNFWTSSNRNSLQTNGYRLRKANSASFEQKHTPAPNDSSSVKHRQDFNSKLMPLATAQSRFEHKLEQGSMNPPACHDNNC